MHKHGRLDANHREVIEALEAIGASVQSLADIGNGCPDLLVGIGLHVVLIEVKDGNKPPSKQRLTRAQIRWNQKWNGPPVYIIRNAEDVTRWIGPLSRGGV